MMLGNQTSSDCTVANAVCSELYLHYWLLVRVRATVGNGSSVEWHDLASLVYF